MATIFNLQRTHATKGAITSHDVRVIAEINVAYT